MNVALPGVLVVLAITAVAFVVTDMTLPGILHVLQFMDAIINVSIEYNKPRESLSDMVT